MKLNTRIISWLAVIVFAGAITLTGCRKKTSTKVADAVENAGDAIKDAATETGEALEDGGDAIEDAGEDMVD